MNLVVLGASAFPEFAGIIDAMNKKEACDADRKRVTAILDDNEELHGQEVLGIPIVGRLEAWRDFGEARFIMGIGSFRNRFARYHIVSRLQIPRDRYMTLIDPAAVVYANVTIGDGCIIWPGATIFGNTILEDFVLLCPNVVIAVHNRIGEGAMIAPLSTTTSDVAIGPYSHVGSSSSVAEGVRIGAFCQVMMGSVVTRNLPAGAVCGGVPARMISKEELPKAISDSIAPDWS